MEGRRNRSNDELEGRRKQEGGGFKRPTIIIFLIAIGLHNYTPPYQRTR